MPGRLLICVLLCFTAPLQAEERKSYQVPYRLTPTKHILVRVKLNGQGPYNFIVDTGAPTFYVATEVAKKLGIEANKHGWATFARCDVEGGVTLMKLRGRVEDLFQLEGMNGLGLAGFKLHGILGFAVLARYRLELDFTRDTMTWTRLAFTPKVSEGAGGQTLPAGVEAVGNIMKFAGAFLGKPPEPRPVPRGFLGIELADDDRGATIRAVLAGGPAAAAGLKAGDRLRRAGGQAVQSSADVYRRVGRLTSGAAVELVIERDGEERAFAVKLGEGL
jgi:hypothetical protein